MTMILLIICVILCHNSAASTDTAAGNDVNGGFSVKLIHRNSPNSPFYTHNKTPSKSLTKTIFFKRPMLYPNSPQSEIRHENGEYLLKLSIGNPPVDVYDIADTGSDLLWTQCVPCEGCYKQIDPKFDPKKSSTFSDLPCAAQECQFIPTSCSPQNLCSYDYEYGDDSVTKGVLAKETITFRSTSGESISLKNTVFGCGHNNTGTSSENDMGIFGLRRGPISLVSRLGSLLGGRKFSYCLAPFHTDPSIESNITFGKGIEVLGEGVVSTPLVLQDNLPFYHVTVKGISGKVSKGNMYLDSGTPTTYISTDLYDPLVAELKKQIPTKPVEDDPNLGTQLCYKSKTNLRGPILTEGVFCFTMTNDTSDGRIYGNFARSNFLTGFDLETRMVSFKPSDCTKEKLP
ncbi:hypothetical protein ACE6H2_022419 [Prunus campanulata]